MKKLADNLLVYGDHDDPTISQIGMCLQNQGEKAVLCADGHLGYSMPIGGVVAYKDKIAISGVGFDIACGNMAVKTKARAADVRNNIGDIMDQIVDKISFGVGRKNKETVDHDIFDDPAWEHPSIKGIYVNPKGLPQKNPELRDLAKSQLGTVGSGNHYVDIFEDEEGFIWVGVHFGSRGPGHKIASYFLKQAGGKDDMHAFPTVVDVDSEIGENYLRGMELAGKFAYAGREWVCQKVVSILHTSVIDTVHNHHNYAWQEKHEGENLFVVRKGATPAFPGQRGFVGGSMGDNAVIVEGVDSDQSADSLYSTVHGAGRIMSRTKAAGKTKWIGGKRTRVSKGLVDPDEVQTWLKEKGVTVRGGGLDEAPQAYRRLDEVLKEHDDIIKVQHVLRPIGVAMAGDEIHDPYKD